MPRDYARILLTGGTGFVGPYLQEALARAYPRARRFVLARPGEAPASPDWSPLVADIVDAEAVERAIDVAQPDLVAHLAAQASAAQSIHAAEATWRVNFLGSFHLASALARHAPSAVVLFVSTADVYGARLGDGPAREETPTSPLSAYARSKIAAETMLADVLPQTARLIVTRPFNHAGPGQDMRFALPSFAAQIAGIETGRLAPRLDVGDLSVRRDFLDVRDVVDAYARLVGAAPDLPPRSLFNIASGAPRSLSYMLDTLRACATRNFDIVVDPARLRPADIPVAVGDASKLRAATGWAPSHSIDAMLRDLLDHWRAQEARAEIR
ncbi:MULTISPECIES: GDP-mannose 4,6-dehydratase [Methylosinus]|uniref:Epimerase n=1 Tax=Methylosinus trichosporium (strain ATCC 35070 / NCIMB 11131 / UNIQEM 75 / OB3b) TaxID=595536 RepID=A0A2D2D2W6_METT3|nr:MULTISPECIES: GDP-mannose 4,6-dehydratase [Methylosinus]ATQ69341.1 epimerase [Methylosinus trichosporium OB3b]OBS52858.1 epimerase [Methylosinus sp. 3S-1]